MKKKVFLFFVLFALSLSLIPRINAYADTVYYPVGTFLNMDAAWTGNANGIYTLYCTNDNGRYPYTQYSRIYLKQGSTGTSGYQCYWYDPINNRYREIVISYGYAPYAYIEDPQFDQPITLNNGDGGICVVYPSYNDFVDSLPDDYKPEVPSDPTWYEELFNDFLDYLDAGLNGGIQGFIDWLTDAWTIPVGEGEDEFWLETISPTPTPTPLPTPTPIPYQTQLVPDGNGGFNITYIYPDPSGNPTSAPQPPTNQPQPSPVVYDNDWEYPYYDNPSNKDDPYSFEVPWYLKFSFNGVTTSLSDFQDGMDAVVDNVNDQDENISVVMDSMGLFPSDWLLMIGFIGAIPLIGGLISRLLKG